MSPLTSSKKIAFYLENKLIPDVDLSCPTFGNPGCGGTEFLFAALPYYMAIHESGEFEPILLANHVNKLPEGVKHIRVADALEAVRCAKKERCSLLVYRPRRDTDDQFLKFIDYLEMPTIAWNHVTPTATHIRALARSRFIRAVVCVEREQHDQLLDSVIRPKLTCIVNGFDLAGFRLANQPAKESGLVVYLGALVPQKGFHLLARAWPRILNRFPKARLAVIGTGALYDASAELGPLGVAERSYEQRYITPFLTTADGQILPSVEFLGKLGSEKRDVLHRAMIGVPNPTGQTENCPGSALEFQACGTAVVSGAYYGMLDTIQDGRTGLLGRDEDDLVDNICELLENPSCAEEMGRNGIRFVEERYNYPGVVLEWLDLFNRLLTNRSPRRIPVKLNLHRHYKLLVVINQLFQMTIGRVVMWPTVAEAKLYILRKKRKDVK